MPDKTYAKFILNNETYLDLTGDTVDSSSLLSGYTAHNRSGEPITGSFDTSIFVLKAGDTMTGPLILSGAPTENLHAATKKYVDDTAANYVTLTTDQDITGTKTFIGQKKILFKQSGTSDKLGFTLYKSDSTEQGYLEYNPSNKIDNAPLFTLGNYATTTSGICQVGFRRYSSVSGANGAYNLLTPLIADAKTPFSLTTTYTNFYLPLGFKVNSSNTLKTAKSGVVDLSYYFTYAREGVKQTQSATSSDTALRVLLSNQGTDSEEVAQVKKVNYFTFDTQNSILTIFRRGSDNTTVKAGLILGNDVAGGTYGNSYGDIVMYGQGTYYYNITGNNPSEALTENRTLTLPNKSGTIAITDDLNSYLPLTGGTLTGNLTISSTSASAGGSVMGALVLGNSTPTSESGSSYGRIMMYSESEYYCTIDVYGVLTDYRSLYLPDKNGTLAVTDDLYSQNLYSNNLIDKSMFYMGSLSGATDTAATTRVRSVFIPVSPSTSYYISNSNTIQIFEIHEYTLSKTFIQYTSINATSATFTTTSTTVYIRVLMRKTDNSNICPFELGNIYLRKTETVDSGYTPYEPNIDEKYVYNLNAYNIGYRFIQDNSVNVLANANLNSTAYLKPGQYYVDKSATVATLTNCPVATAFTMNVENPISPIYGDESSRKDIYRIRRITALGGDQYIQYCACPTTANTWVYGAWNRVETETSGTTTVGSIVWTWKKHSNGMAEMWADVTLNGTWVTWGNMYYLSYNTLLALPFTLTKKIEDVTTYLNTVSTMATSAFPINYTSMGSYNVNNYTSCDLARPTAGDNNKNYYCRKYIKGLI